MAGAASLSITASIGIALSGPEATDTDELLQQADAAMYRAKRAKTTGWALAGDDLATTGS